MREEGGGRREEGGGRTEDGGGRREEGDWTDVEARRLAFESPQAGCKSDLVSGDSDRTQELQRTPVGAKRLALRQLQFPDAFLENMREKTITDKVPKQIEILPQN